MSFKTFVANQANMFTHSRLKRVIASKLRKKTPPWLSEMVPYGVLPLLINQNLNPTKIATFPRSSRPSDCYKRPLFARLGVMNKVYLLALRNSSINCRFLSLVSSLSCAFLAKRAFIFLRFDLSLRSCDISTLESCDNLCWNFQSYMLPLR